MTEDVMDKLILEDPDPESELSCSDLGVHICLHDRESPSLSLRGTTSLGFWKHLPSEERETDLQTKLTYESTSKTDLFQHDIFHHQKVHVGNSLRWSKHLIAESRSTAQMSVSNISCPAEGVSPGIKDMTHSVHSSVEIHLPAVDPGHAVMVRNIEEIQRGHDDMIVLQDPDVSQTSQNIQDEDLDEFDDTEDLAEDLTEELGEPVTDKSVRRRFINLLNDLWADRIRRKIARTYMREKEEGDQFYRSSYLAYPTMTRAQAERRKRQLLVKQDRQRQWLKNLLDVYWQIQRAQKEELRRKEEQRYTKWASKNSQSTPGSSPDQPKKRMSRWEKKFLRVKDFLF